MSPEATYVLESLATVAAFGGALWLALWGLRRVSGAPSKGPLEVIARQPLDGRRAIYLVRVGKRVLVVGATDSSLTRLGATTLDALRRDEAEQAAQDGTRRADEPAKTGFRDALARVLGRAPRPPE